MKFTDIKTTEVYWDEHIQPRFNDLYTYYNSIGNEELIMDFRSMIEESLKYYFTDTIDLHESRAIRKTGYEYTFFKQYHTKINNFARSFTPYYLTDIKVRDKGYYHIQGITVPGYSFSLHTPLNNQGLPDEAQESFISGSTLDTEKELIKKIIADFYNMIENRIEDAIRECDIQDQDHVYYRLPGLLTYAIDHFYRNREDYAIDYDPAEHAQTLSYQDVKIIIPSDKGYLGGEVHIGDDSIRLQVGGSDEAIQRTGYFIKDEKQELDFISGKFVYYIFGSFVNVIQSIKTGHMRYVD